MKRSPRCDQEIAAGCRPQGGSFPKADEGVSAPRAGAAARAIINTAARTAICFTCFIRGTFAHARGNTFPMVDPMEPSFTGQNPIVAAAERIRAQRALGELLEESDVSSGALADGGAESSLRAFGDALAVGIKRLNAILGERNGVRLVRLEKPLRLRLRFGEHRIALELDESAELVRVRGLTFDGDYQFVPDRAIPSLIDVSKVSTESGYGESITPSMLLRALASDAELPRPPHLDSPGPLSF